MKRIFLSLTILSITLVANAQMDIPPDGGNVKAMIAEEVGITGITISYCRPGVKGREGNIWGGVVAYGFGSFNFGTGTLSSPWRAGANEATVISFEHDVRVEGHDLKAGSYGLFLAMGKDTVTVIFSRQKEAWGSFYYREEDDVLRVNVKAVSLDKSVEWLKYEFTEHTDTSCVIAMQWEKVSVPFRVEVDVDRIVMARIKEQLVGVKGFLSANLIQISRYYFAKNRHLDEALGWAQRAVTGKPFGQSGYDAYTTLALGYEKLGRQPQADSVMLEGLHIASVSQHMAYGKTLIAHKRHDKTLEVMLAARARFGDIYVVNQGLANAYSAMGNYRQALEYAQKALVQAPNSQAKDRIIANIEKLKAGKDIN